MHQQKERLCTQVQIYARMQKEALRKQITLLDAYSPLAILQRGYALVEQQDTLIKSAQQLPGRRSGAHSLSRRRLARTADREGEEPWQRRKHLNSRWSDWM